MKNVNETVKQIRDCIGLLNVEKIPHMKINIKAGSTNNSESCVVNSKHCPKLCCVRQKIFQKKNCKTIGNFYLDNSTSAVVIGLKILKRKLNREPNLETARHNIQK